MTELLHRVSEDIERLAQRLGFDAEDREIAKSIARLAIEETAKEAAEICENLKLTEQGPDIEAKRQRALCANAIRQRFGLKP